MIILGVSLASTNYLIYAEAPEALFEWVGAHIHDRFTFLLLLNVFLLALGAFLDIFSAIVLVVPLILPVAIGYDIHPVHLGIIFLANMQLGYLTPPVGLNLFLASFASNSGRWMQFAALGILGWELTESSAFLGYIIFAQLAPLGFLSLLGGSLADTANRRTLLLSTRREVEK